MGDGPALVTVPNVELLAVGQGWRLGTGTRDFSLEDLQSAIASQDDPAVRTPIIHLGHIDPRFDGEPAIGRITNLRLSSDSLTLIGDLEGVPAWLCEMNAEGDYILSTAFPRRSIEGMADHVTATGNKWPLVLTGLALLGAAYPAITTLADIQKLYSDEAPELVPVEELEYLVASSPQEVNTVPARRVLASITMDEVRTAYYDSLGPSQMWWWIRTVLVDPFELIVDDDDGHLHRVPVTVSGDAITFGDPIEVAIEYRDVQVAAGARIAASYSDHEAAGRPVRASDEEVTPPGVTVPPSEEVDVNLSEAALAALGLQPGATEEQINEAIVAKAAEAAAQPPVAGEGEPAPEKEGEPSTGTPPPASPEQPPAAPGTGPANPAEPSPDEEGASAPMGELKVPEGFALVDTATLEALKSGVNEAMELVAATRKAEDEQLLASAVRSGKIMASRLGDYRTALERDREGTKALLASMPDDLVPVQLRGENTGDTPKGDGTATEYPSDWAPTVAASHRGITGSRIKVVAD